MTSVFLVSVMIGSSLQQHHMFENTNGDITYGMVLSLQLPYHAAMDFCIQLGYDHVVIFKEFGPASSLLDFDPNMPQRKFWNGLRYFDSANTTDWYYEDGSKYGSNIVRASSVENCTTFEYTRFGIRLPKSENCNNQNHILCERRSDPLHTLRTEIQSQPATAENVEKWLKQMNDVTQAQTLTTVDVQQGIQLLQTLRENGREFQTTEKSVQHLFEIVGNYHNFIENKTTSFQINQRESIVKTVEDFSNRLNLTNENTTIASFSSTSLNGQIQYTNKIYSQLGLTYKGQDNLKITLPGEAFSKTENSSGVGNRSRVSFVEYSDSVLFTAPCNSTQVNATFPGVKPCANTMGNLTIGRQFIATKVISAQIDGIPVKNLTSSVIFTYSINYNITQSVELEFQCVWWNFTSSTWSHDGCLLISNQNQQPKCACNHLTNFAILVRVVERQATISSNVFNFVNTIIGAVSCVGFLLTAFIHVYYKDLRTTKPGPIHINLCLCLFMSYLIFLVGSDKTSSKLACLFVTVFTHYFLLASWGWMLVEAVVMFVLLVKRVRKLDRNFLIVVFVLVYTIPAVIVGGTIGIQIALQSRQNSLQPTPVNWASTAVYSTYMHDKFCWLRGGSLYFGFLTEGAILFLVITVLYVWILREITWRRQKVIISKIGTSPKESVCRGMALASIFGLVWILAIPLESLASSNASQTAKTVLTYIFSVLVAAQGVFVFIFFCVRNKNARKLWLNPLQQKFRDWFRPKQGLPPMSHFYISDTTIGTEITPVRNIYVTEMSRFHVKTLND